MDTSQLEYSVIGAICIDPKICDKISSVLSPDDFSISACGEVFEAACDALGRGKHFDAVIAADAIRNRVDDAVRFIGECMDISLARIAFSDEVSEASRKLAASGLKIILTTLIFALIGAACGFGPAGAIVGGVIGLVAGTLIQIQAINFDDSLSEKEKQKAAGILKTVLYGIIGALIGAAIGGVFGGIIGGVVGISLGLAIHWSSITYDEVPRVYLKTALRCAKC